MNTIISMIKAIRDRALGSIIETLTDHEQRITTLENAAAASTRTSTP